MSRENHRQEHFAREPGNAHSVLDKPKQSDRWRSQWRHWQVQANVFNVPREHANTATRRQSTICASTTMPPQARTSWHAPEPALNMSACWHGLMVMRQSFQKCTSINGFAEAFCYHQLNPGPVKSKQLKKRKVAATFSMFEETFSID